MRIAFFSDVHANLPALEAILRDIDSQRPDARHVLGDLVGYAPWPNEVLERLQANAISAVMGNYDEGTGFDLGECGCAYTDPVEEALGDASFAWTKARTTEQSLQYQKARQVAFPVPNWRSPASPRPGMM